MGHLTKGSGHPAADSVEVWSSADAQPMVFDSQETPASGKPLTSGPGSASQPQIHTLPTLFPHTFGANRRAFEQAVDGSRDGLGVMPLAGMKTSERKSLKLSLWAPEPLRNSKPHHADHGRFCLPLFLGGKPLSLRWDLTADIPMPFMGGMLVGSSGTCLVVLYSQRVALCQGLDLGKLNTWLASSSDGTQLLSRLDTGGKAHVFELAKGWPSGCPSGGRSPC